MAQAVHVRGSHSGAAQQRVTSPAWAVVLPVVLGVLYGLWAASIRRHGGPPTLENVLFGVVCGAIVALACMVLHQIAHLLPPLLRAASWAGFTGIAVGFLYSQSGISVLRCAGTALAVAALAFVTFFYRYYTTE
ncbi:hypothetical protein SLNWT_3496 [Streptomyces albus]|uniref:Uncharacterized protein n=1 Tax=Streptomyces albus (strain ATCC 21838 / DSM 41398 / FERM P-419 / JCM 4703 / NBRC 107858) TaxID=1081613 RepID=A0A0B5F0P2_STRA4|nr:hypothetical protein SLNWT_3496 [Streptomyces albus]AOU78176.1 hypothetical protein SLNHY_3485 [Streptomyces albus]AYN33931.1 hypothetical protein DUI70_3430 [Streptomyces albus]